MMKIIRTVALILAVVLIGGGVAASIHFRKSPAVSGSEISNVSPSTGTGNGNLPLTVQNTAPYMPLVNYKVLGAIQVNRSSDPISPIPPVFVGASSQLSEGDGLTLTLTTLGSLGGGSSKTIFLPGVEPLRALVNGADEIDFSSQTLTRRIGVCTDPVVSPGIVGTYGQKYPSVTLQIITDSGEASYSGIETTHWSTVKRRDFIVGKDLGMSVQSGVFSVNLPKATYRQFVTGACGASSVEDNLVNAYLESGLYRVDFYDGSSRFFELGSDIHGIPSGSFDVLVVSRSGVSLHRNTVTATLSADSVFTPVVDYNGTGVTVYSVSKASLGAATYEGNGGALAKYLCGHFSVVTSFNASTEVDVTFCDGENVYFYVPSLGSDFFSDYVSALSDDHSFQIVLPAAETSVSAIAFSSETPENAESYSLLENMVINDAAFDTLAEYTLVPAFREWMEEERAQGRPVEIYYSLSDEEIVTVDLKGKLPRLFAGSGDTTFSVSCPLSASIAMDPTKGYFEAYLCAE